MNYLSDDDIFNEIGNYITIEKHNIYILENGERIIIRRNRTSPQNYWYNIQNVITSYSIHYTKLYEHEKNQSWKSVNDFSEQENENIKCSNCGETNPSTGLFCKKCGVPLSKAQQTNPFPNTNLPPFGRIINGASGGYEQLTEESEIDGIKLKEYNQYVEKNQNFFISNFIKFSKFRSKFSFNIPAMVFPEYYFFYRKMNLYGIIFFVIRLALYVPNLVASLVDGYWASTIFSGLVGANISISNFVITSYSIHYTKLYD